MRRDRVFEGFRGTVQNRSIDSGKPVKCGTRFRSGSRPVGVKSLQDERAQFVKIIQAEDRDPFQARMVDCLFHASSHNRPNAPASAAARSSRAPSAPSRVGRSQFLDYGFAYTSALITSIPTNGWLPSTQASCPGGIVYDSPAAMVFSVPSFKRIVIRPETA